MIYKHDLDCSDLDCSLKLLLEILDAWTQMFFNEEITITSAIRPVGDNPSYHPKGQAVDIRTKGVSDLAVMGWRKLIKTVNANNEALDGFKGRFTWLHEDIGKENEHFHLQLTTNNPI